ncbi:DUF896 domain-containing protein [Siminovitchia sp. FSL H7-0308]|uniref:UPF0291 protein JOC94_003654 n=1 Tax=Siminovitchia thermophila TaxID=1245522 RepID=A0ABS2RAE5_9BACI|nr:DUF896 domain-containing protein [Siminovitchia thermophila]MBM7716633.1 uncharacterized protein YnzC (UPF0291/DUF896 family) [Siminovitchia thermophila]ONK24332.1 hypothetical protein BLX87_05725 [Bacillus sp. VT-16-64]
MLSKEKLARINALARKAKEKGLSKEEAKEQSRLRGEYLKAFRSSMKQTIEQVRVFDSTGQEVTPEKLRSIQLKKKLH